jgi:hypothetical protein
MSLECLILFGGDLRDCKGEGLNTRFVSASNIESLARRWLKLEPREKKRNEGGKKRKQLHRSRRNKQNHTNEGTKDLEIGHNKVYLSYEQKLYARAIQRQNILI